MNLPMSFVDITPCDGYKAPTNTCAHPCKPLLSNDGVALSMDVNYPPMACNNDTSKQDKGNMPGYLKGEALLRPNSL